MVIGAPHRDHLAMDLTLVQSRLARWRWPLPAASSYGVAALLGCLWVQHQAQLLPPTWVIGLLLAAAVLLLAMSRWSHCGARWCCCFAVALLFAMNAQWRAHQGLQERLVAADEGRTLHLLGIVEQMPIAFERGTRFVFRVERCVDVSHCAVGGRLRLSWFRNASTAKTPLRPGQRWRLTVRAKQVHAMLNPGLFDAELRALEDGIGASGYVRSGVLEPVQDGWLPRLWSAPLSVIEQLRMRVRESMLRASAGANPVAAGVSVALVIGDQTAIGGAQWELFNRTGVGHLMSISGLHITMLAGVAAYVVGALWRARWLDELLARCWPKRHAVTPIAWLSRPIAQRLAAVTTAFAYSALAGWGVPAQRTCWMLLAAALASVLGRAGSPLAVVAFALLPVLWLDPWACGSAGFWLSFCAVAAIIWYGERRVYRRSRWHSMREGLRAQFAVTIALVPLGALFFSSVALASPLANAFAIPLVSFVVTPLSLLAAAVSLLSTTVAGWLLWLPLLLNEYLIKMLVWFDRFSAVHALPYPDVFSLLCAVLGIVVLLSHLIPGRAVALFALLPLLLKPVAKPQADELWLTALDVGQGMTVLVETADGNLLYDTGPAYGGENDAGARVLTPYLRGRGINALDRVVVSHLDQDHSGGTRAILRNFSVGRLLSSIDDDDPLLKYARGKHVPFERCQRGEQWRWGQVLFEWLHPGPEPTVSKRSQTNANSCVLRIESPAGSLLLTGDIEAAQEKQLVETLGAQRLSSSLLLAPHHGSQSSSSALFLAAVQPQIALFQVGYRNRFKHPNSKVWARYQDSGAQLLRSDAHGAIIIKFKRDKPVLIERYRVDTPRYWRVAVPL